LNNQPVTPVPVQMVPKPEARAAAHPQGGPAANADRTAEAAQPTTMAPPSAAGQPAATLPPGVDPMAATQMPQAGQAYGMSNQNSRVVLRVQAMTKVLVTGPGQKVFINRVLKPGDSYRVPDVIGVTLTTPDGGAIAVDLDGQTMGMAGRKAQMIEALSLDPQAIADRANGRQG
jgi:cytoskeleton protein RodZ